MPKDYSWMEKTKGGKRKSSYSKDPVLGSVSAEARRNMKDSEVGFSVRGIQKKRYLKTL